MSQFIKFDFTSSMLNMFRTLIPPSSGACDFSIVSPHWLCDLVSMCIGVSLWLGWGGIHVGGRLKPMLNMFQTLIHPSSGACDFSIVSPHWICVLVSMCFGVSVWLGWGDIRVGGRLKPATTQIPPQPSHTETSTHIETRSHDQCGDTIEKSQAPDDGCINVRNMLSIEEVK